MTNIKAQAQTHLISSGLILALLVLYVKTTREACNPGAGENWVAGLKCGTSDDEGKGICISEQPPPSTPLGEGKSDVKIGFIDIYKKLDKFIVHLGRT